MLLHVYPSFTRGCSSTREFDSELQDLHFTVKCMLKGFRITTPMMVSVFSAGEQADLIFVFFDPMGQALCKRTLNIVEKLSEKCGDKLLFYLSKADEAGKETDRQVAFSFLSFVLVKF